MKIILLLTALCLLIATAFLSANNQTVELKVGDKAPSFSLYDQDNKLHKLSDYKGQRLIIYYFPKADTPG
jgi:peroxiredoxin|tara:strand:+ start:2582 stop:2791 length:210 start_codon:yes stop_codon:yes gene_type:complete